MQPIEGGSPLLFGEVDEGVPLLGIEGAGLLARRAGQLAHSLPFGIDGKQVTLADQDQLIALFIDQRFVRQCELLALLIRFAGHLRCDSQLAWLAAAGIEAIEFPQP